MAIIKEELLIKGFKKVLFFREDQIGFKAIIAIHSTQLGPSLGGTRIFPYLTFEEGLEDVLRLAEGMTQKNGLLNVGLGGAKSVIFKSEGWERNKRSFLHCFAQCVNTLEGEYWCAEDVGCDVESVAVIAEETSYVVGTSGPLCPGNPSPFTARGVFVSMQELAKEMLGKKTLQGVRIAIQGVGSVGEELVKFLYWEGADIVATDVDTKKLKQLQHLYGVKVVSTEKIYSEPCEIFAPCALGGVLNDTTIPLLNTKMVIGCANNQLKDFCHAKMLQERGIIYVPDFLVNAGGALCVMGKVHGHCYSARKVQRQLVALGERVVSLYQTSKESGVSLFDETYKKVEYLIKDGQGVEETFYV
jgi:leucine dehydrogenase